MQEQPKEFYVGYLALPKRLRLTIAGLILTLFAAVTLDAYLIATLQPESGDGVWADKPLEYTGTVYRTPYPILRLSDKGAVRTYVLISDEKRGAEAALDGIADGTAVKLSAYLIERAAVGMLQLAANDITKSTSSIAIPEAAREIHGRKTLTGEIVDSKCWLGVMRPGDGHIHKSCASICLRGGIPPMFVTRQSGIPPVMLLSSFDGNTIPPDRILDFVADPVELSGLIEKRGDVYVFKADLSTLRRTEPN